MGHEAARESHAQDKPADEREPEPADPPADDGLADPSEDPESRLQASDQDQEDDPGPREDIQEAPLEDLLREKRVKGRRPDPSEERGAHQEAHDQLTHVMRKPKSRGDLASDPGRQEQHGHFGQEQVELVVCHFNLLLAARTN